MKNLRKLCLAILLSMIGNNIIFNNITAMLHKDTVIPTDMPSKIITAKNQKNTVIPIDMPSKIITTENQKNTVIPIDMPSKIITTENQKDTVIQIDTIKNKKMAIRSLKFVNHWVLRWGTEILVDSLAESIPFFGQKLKNKQIARQWFPSKEEIIALQNIKKITKPFEALIDYLNSTKKSQYITCVNCYENLTKGEFKPAHCDQEKEEYNLRNLGFLVETIIFDIKNKIVQIIQTEKYKNNYNKKEVFLNIAKEKLTRLFALLYKTITSFKFWNNNHIVFDKEWFEDYKSLVFDEIDKAKKEMSLGTRIKRLLWSLI